MMALFILAAAACTDLSGTWVNELGSVATFFSSGSSILFGGVYTSSVGKASDAYELFGTYDNESCEPTLSWLVTWNNAYQKKQLDELVVRRHAQRHDLHDVAVDNARRLGGRRLERDACRNKRLHASEMKHKAESSSLELQLRLSGALVLFVSCQLS